MKPRIPRTHDAVQAELDDWRHKVSDHHLTLALLAYPPPSATPFDADRIQTAGHGPDLTAGIDSTARRTVDAIAAIEHRQQTFAQRRTFPQAALAAVDRNDLAWVVLERLLLDMRPVADQASNLHSAGPRPEWRPPHTYDPYNRGELLAAKARRDMRGESETVTEPGVGLTASRPDAGGVAVKRRGDRYRTINPRGAQP